MTNLSTDTATDVPEFPMTRAPGCPFAPPPKVLELNADKQLSRVRIWDGSTPWLITGYDAIRALFTDSRVSVDDRRPGYPHWNEGMLATVHTRPRSVFTSDAEEHTRYRRMLSKPFTFRRVEALRPTVQKIVDDQIDALLAGPRPGDIVSTLALPVPSLVISALLGVPYEDAGFFQEQAERGTGRYATEEDTAQGAASSPGTWPSCFGSRCKALQGIWSPTRPSGSRLKSSPCARPRSCPPGCSSPVMRPPPT
jgi:cytochrome P450